MQESWLKKRKDTNNSDTVVASPKPKIKPERMFVPSDIVGKQIKHKSWGNGKIVETSKTSIVVDFENIGLKTLGYEVCIKNKLIEIV